jgi:uncharacterized integral membrane protein
MADETQEQAPQQQAKKSSISVRQVIGALVLIAFVVFLIENNHQVTVRLLVPEEDISLSLALLIAGVLGALGLLLIQRRRRHK